MLDTGKAALPSPRELIQSRNDCTAQKQRPVMYRHNGGVTYGENGLREKPTHHYCTNLPVREKGKKHLRVEEATAPEIEEGHLRWKSGREPEFPRRRRHARRQPLLPVHVCA